MLKTFAIYRIKINIFGTSKRNKEAVSKRQYTVQLYWLSKDRQTCEISGIEKFFL